MEVNFLDKTYSVEEFVQYEQIRYSQECSCKCEHSTYINGNFDIVGYCLTYNGYMVVFECPVCFEKYRHHISTGNRFNIETLKKDLGLKFYLKEKRR
jgi:hypothetical protein